MRASALTLPTPDIAEEAKAALRAFSALPHRRTSSRTVQESTSGGRQIQGQRFFDPNSDLTAEQAREIWQLVVRRFALAARGEVHLFVDGSPKGSVFEKVVIPALKENPNVKLVWHSKSSRSGD